MDRRDFLRAILGGAAAGLGMTASSLAAPFYEPTLQELVDMTPVGGTLMLKKNGVYRLNDTLWIRKPMLLDCNGATIYCNGLCIRYNFGPGHYMVQNGNFHCTLRVNS